MSLHPPKWATRFLRWYCKNDHLDEIEGDLFELFYLRAKKSRNRASLFYVWDVIRTFRGINLKENRLLRSTGMLNSYFKIGFRSLIKDLRFSMINLAGLSIGLAVFLAIVLLVKHELSFDKFHSKGERVYQVIQLFQNADGPDPEIYTSSRLAKALRSELSTVESAVFIHGAASTWAEVNGNRFFEEDGIVAESQFFELFDFELLKGEPTSVLANKRSIVLTESLSKKFFGYEDPIGEEVELDMYGRFTVTGILKDIPLNSYIQFNYLITQDYDVFLENVSPNFREVFQSWLGDQGATYVLLDDPLKKETFEIQIEELLQKYLGEDREINPHYLLGLQDLHFHSHGIDGRVNRYVKGDYGKVQFLIGVAIIILSMACFNYINISTARYIKRTREVGIRKAMGAHQIQVTLQFLIESFLMVLGSFLIGLILVYYLLPYLNRLTGIELVLDVGLFVEVLPYFNATIVLVTLLAGFYPAFHLSRFPTISVLKNQTISVKGNGMLRKGLITVQYTFVLSILAALVIVNKQYSYISNKSLGFTTDELVIVEINSGSVRNNYETIKTELLQLSGVSQVTGLTRMISGYRSGTSVTMNHIQSPDEIFAAKFYGMDVDGVSTMELELVAGENFSGMTSNDSISILINETAAKNYGGSDVIGKFLEIKEIEGNTLRAKVIGVVKDFHYRSLRKSIGPVVIGHYKNPFIGLDDIVIQLNGNNAIATLESIEAIHNQFDTNDIMTWEFMDDMVQGEYEKEQTFRNIFVGASILSFFIALLGMIGLTSYSVTSRTKEIGIRKILGATVMNILNMGARELVRFLILSALVSIPLSWWFANSWLLNFEYRISISPLTFVWIVGFMMITTFSVVFLAGYKVARSSPADAIRNE